MMGYFFALLIGLGLGLMGGGGSILTVPILIYLMGMEPKVSIPLSLGIVALTSLVGVFRHAKDKNVNFQLAFFFGPFTMVGSFLGARLSQFLSDQEQLLFFSVIMLIASFFMMRDQKDLPTERARTKENKTKLILLMSIQGLAIGLITGIVGVGGGFLIVPALVLILKQSMREAIGTSLLIISMNSVTGLLGHLGQVIIPWTFLAKFSALSVIGIFLGSSLAHKISQKKLKKSFGYFLIVIGCFVLYKNLAFS